MRSASAAAPRAVRDFVLVCLASGMAAASPGRALAGQGSGPAAQDLTGLSIEELMHVEVVVAASRREQDAGSAPSSVTVVSADEIERYGYRTLSDVLAAVSGFHTAYDRQYEYVGVRGFLRPGDYNSRVLILIDGCRVNDTVYNQGPVGNEFPLDVRLAKRVEIVRGPGSSLYGTNALFAVVNVVTKTGADVGGAELAASAGTGDSFGGRAVWGGTALGCDLMISGSAHDSEGMTVHFDEFQDPSTNNGYAENDYEQFANGFLRVSHGSFTLAAAHVSRTKGIPTGAWGTVFCDERNRSVDEQTSVDLSWERGSVETLAVLSRAHHAAYRYAGDYVFEEDSGTVVNHDVGEGVWWGGEVLITKRLLGSHLLSVGAEYQNNTRQDQSNYDTEITYLDSRERSESWGVYVQDECRVADHVTVHAGLRYDSYETFGGDWNPRIAVVYRPGDATSMKLLYGGAFRAPSPYEFYYHDGWVSQKPSPDLGPESVTSYEVVLERRLSPMVDLRVSAFSMRLDDLIDLYADPVDSLFVYRNMERAESRGVEVSVERRLVGDRHARLSYTYQDARDASTDERLTGSPRHVAKAHVAAPLAGRCLFGALEALYVGERPTVAGSTAEAYVVLNANVIARAEGSPWAVSARVGNLLDAEHADPGSEEHVQDAIEQDGRTLLLEVSRRW